ncbi:MAG: hypothetical protein K2X38_11005 [Gemmataceae bacterium]|nr:hypothetical protein [Gemmataceae bacterium]
MKSAASPFGRKDNLVLEIAQPELAQSLLEEQTRTDWPRKLRMLRR